MGKINEEIKRLEQENFDLMVKSIRVKAIKEFAERLKERASKGFWESDAYIGIEQIDDIVKEMVGDNDE